MAKHDLKNRHNYTYSSFNLAPELRPDKTFLPLFSMFPYLCIVDNSVDGIVLVFADVANSDVVSVVTKEEEGSICGD